MAVALITGGSRGIGAATVVRLAQDGHDVAVAYRAGINDRLEQDLRKIDAAGWDRVMAVSLRAPFLTARLIDGGIRPS